MSYDNWKQNEPDIYDPGRLRDEHEWQEPDACDTCGETIGLMGRVTLAGVGLFCSRTCANVGSAKHEAAMSRRRSA